MNKFKLNDLVKRSDGSGGIGLVTRVTGKGDVKVTWNIGRGASEWTQYISVKHLILVKDNQLKKRLEEVNMGGD